MELRRGCELSEATLGSLAGFSERFRELFGDKRLYEGFVGTLQGILRQAQDNVLAAGTVIISRILRSAPDGVARSSPHKTILASLGSLRGHATR